MYYTKLVDEINILLSQYKKIRYGELVGAPWPYTHDGPMVYEEPEPALLEKAATAITTLLARAEEAEARAEKAERERDAAVADLLKAEQAVNETYDLLGDEVPAAGGYTLYSVLFDSVSNIVNWEHADVWRKQEE